MRKTIAGAALAAMTFTALTATAALTPGQRCEAGKNDASGRYAACMARAERKLILKGKPAKYTSAAVDCTSNLVGYWNRLEHTAELAGASCITTADQVPIQTFLDACGQSVAEALSGGVLGPDPVTCALDLTTCDSSLGTCSGNLSSTNADLGMCTSSLTTATGSLTTCNANYATCSGSLATANAGTASVGDVLSGKTFTSAAGLGATGTMANNGSVTLTPTTSAQSIAAGYHDGTGSCAGDADLVAGNIKSGVNLFGVNGSSSVVNTSGATAAAADMLSGKTAYVSGSLVTGVVAAGASVGGSNGSKTFTIPDGLYSGSKTATANDTDLAAGNIASGVNIFGVVGTMAAGSAGAQTLNTGQTLCYDAAGAEIACAGTGQDGELRKGATRILPTTATAPSPTTRPA